MSDTVSWRDVKAKARVVDPRWDSSERTARRREMRERLLAGIRRRHGRPQA